MTRDELTERVKIWYFENERSRDSVFENMADFAATIAADAVREERERLKGELRLLNDEPFKKDDFIRARNFEAWFAREFAAELEANEERK